MSENNATYTFQHGATMVVKPYPKDRGGGIMLSLGWSNEAMAIVIPPEKVKELIDYLSEL